MRARAPIDRVLNSIGLTIVGSRKVSTPSVRRIGRLPSGFGHLRRDLGRPFEVELDRITTSAGFSFFPGGWHPYIATLEEMIDDPTSPYAGSVLERYYSVFQPQSVAEALLPGREAPRPLGDWPPTLATLVHFWSAGQRRPESLARQQADRPRRQEIGPQSAEFGERQRRRVYDCYRSFVDTGFRPDDFRDGRLSGYFLVRADDYRFVVTHGNHRLAGLRRIGVDRVPLRFDREIPPVVNEHELSRWCRPRGPLTPEAAAAVFRVMFDGSGHEKAQRLGLI